MVAQADPNFFFNFQKKISKKEKKMLKAFFLTCGVCFLQNGDMKGQFNLTKLSFLKF